MKSSVHVMVLGLLATLLVTGCSTSLGTLSTLWQRPGGEAEALLRYAHKMQSLSAAELSREYAQGEQAFSTDKSPEHRLRLALLLTLPGTPFRDNARALQLVEEYRRQEPQDQEALRNLATLLVVLMTETQKYETLYALLNAKVDAVLAEKSQQEELYKDTEKKLHSLLATKKQQDVQYKKLMQKLEQEKERTEKLQKKLEEIMRIERSINERKYLNTPST